MISFMIFRSGAVGVGKLVPRSNSFCSEFDNIELALLNRN